MSKKYTQEDLDRILDNIKSGPIGQKSQLYWNRFDRALNLSSNPEVLEKRGKNISDSLKGRKIYKPKAKKPILAYKVIKASANKNSPIVGKEFIGRYESAYDAAADLKLHQGDIANVLRPKSNCISVKGYSFEYA
jgi:hypothetical protein